ncbi:MYXO-CTERM sorting domain-containing protein [Archangium lipolyticum]|uniref:MYXO-CTERM sorting domain-containing protein n=1 Tax=Archangium lipolyticum TaxID=2970465 RepID=UPI0021499E3A|nr:MYXO-CTERM sorting domain-containing protein [Archangium lipolyticum]
MRPFRILAAATSALLFTPPAVAATEEGILDGHPVVLDSQGKLLSWLTPQETAYDQTVRLSWEFLKTGLPLGANGLPLYYSHSTFDFPQLTGGTWIHNPAGLNAMMVDSAISYHAYSGDRTVLDLVRGALEHQLAHGTTPEEWSWGGVPYASAEAGAVDYRGVDDVAICGYPCGRGDGVGAIEPDKVGELGLGYLKFYELTGEKHFLEASLRCANALVDNVRTDGDSHRSPWPFRVYAENNVPREEYTANVIGPIKLFEELIRLRLGRVQDYERTRQLAWEWLLAYPMKNGAWSGYFEDVLKMEDPWQNINQYIPMETARYMLEHPERDPDWARHVPALIAWVEEKFAQDTPDTFNEKGLQWGAHAISEQIEDMGKMGSHTARYASINARWHELTGDPEAREKAYRSFNWATYLSDEQGAVSAGVNDSQGWWFTDGYGDYIRHFMAGMGSIPEWSPPGENHLLRSSSVVRQVSYSSGQLSYVTFDANATEVLRVMTRPTSVRAGDKRLEERNSLSSEGYTLQPLPGGDFALRVRHQRSGDVRISFGAEDANGCGCTSGADAGATLVPLLLVGLGLRRRREQPPCQRGRV